MDFSIELAAERIHDSRTKEYFGEVLSSFANGNHRSAIVMLWTVVICDLIYKLQELRDAHGDAVAQRILEEITDLQERNPTSPDWERTLLEVVRARTKLLDPGEALGLDQIQQLRHLSAHPVLRSQEILFRPNRETVRAHVRNALEALFLKPPIFTREVVQEFVVDLAEKKDVFPDDASLDRYIRAKYLSRFVPELENRLFRSLWKFTFNLDNPETNANREINYRALALLFRRRQADLLGQIAAQRDYFSAVTPGEPTAYLIRFLGQFPQIYELLTDAARVVLSSRVTSDVDSFILSWFRAVGMQEHITAVQERLIGVHFMEWEQPSASAWAEFVRLAREAGLGPEAIAVGIRLYGDSFSFDDADERFAVFVEPYLDEITRENLVLLLEESEKNGETTGRRRARRDHALVLDAVERVLGPDFDLSPYPDFVP